jgi:hypothetical protein
MANKYYIGKKSITSGGGIHKPNKVVTPKIMGMTDEEFAAAVERGGIKEGTPPNAKKGAPEPVLREDRILQAVRDLFNPDGSRISDDDFNQDGKPSCDALNVTALVPGEQFVTSPERDVAWEKYEAEQAAKAAG